jgi:hypothetical protein
MAATATGRTPPTPPVVDGGLIKLTYWDDDRILVEDPKCEDRFVMTAQDMIKACQRHSEDKRTIQFFKEEVLRPLFDWSKSHPQVAGCYIPEKLRWAQVFVVTESEQYDFGLGAEISKLELQFFDAHGLNVQITQLPRTDEDCVRTFFNTDGAIEVYAKGK